MSVVLAIPLLGCSDDKASSRDPIGVARPAWSGCDPSALNEVVLKCHLNLLQGEWNLVSSSQDARPIEYDIEGFVVRDNWLTYTDRWNAKGRKRIRLIGRSDPQQVSLEQDMSVKGWSCEGWMDLDTKLSLCCLPSAGTGPPLEDHDKTCGGGALLVFQRKAGPGG